jgi:hypothetical protein
MKLLKILISFIALVSLQIVAAQWLNVPPPAEAKMLMMQGGVPVAAGGCTTVSVSQLSADDDNGVCYSAAQYYWGQVNFDPGANLSVCKVTFKFSQTGTVSGYTYKAKIWNVSSNELDGAAIGTSTGVTGLTGLNATDVDFTFSSPVSLTNGTLYAITVDHEQAADSSNYIRIHSLITGGSLSGSGCRWYSDGLLPTVLSAYDLYIKIYTQ